jgi:NADP-dependent aldehyde dehydrogenase
VTTQIMANAAAAADELATWTGERRRDILRRVAAALSDSFEELLPIVEAETGLGRPRLESEAQRTVAQLRTYGDFVGAGHDRPVTVSTAAAADAADVVLIRVPVGPVAIFAASNFPLAFGVLGTDVISAIAAGCPVVVKTHPAQPRTSAALAALATTALTAAGAPTGTFVTVHGGPQVSLALVRDPVIQAVGFTGSQPAGRALMDAAAARPDPIPVYAEMGSLNPVFVLPCAVADSHWPLTLAAAVTTSAGQLCTKPGLVVVPDTEEGAAFASQLATQVAAASGPCRLLTSAMADAHDAWLGRAVAYGQIVAAPPGQAVRPFAVVVSANTLSADLLTEHFGPAVAIYRTAPESYLSIVDALPGSLTATILAGPGDEDALRHLLPRLARRAGRIVHNGVPTGVAVCDAMHHGGPWPSASTSSFTSVGTAAIQRFLRPLALQGVPAPVARSLQPA